MRIVSFVTLVLSVVGPAFAVDPPELVAYQGVLRAADGAALDGNYDMVFRFTDGPVGGTLLLTDYHTGPDAVVVERGLFTTMLGGGTLAPGTESSLTAIFTTYPDVFVEVQVGAETLAPRVQIASVPYAINAARLGGALPSGFVTTGPEDQIKQGALSAEGGFIAEPPATSGDVRAFLGTTYSSSGVAMLGSALATTGPTEGVRGQSTSPDGTGVVGGAFALSGATTGVLGESQSPDGTGVYGRATSATGGTVGVGGEIFSTLGTGVAGVARATSGDSWGVYGETASPTGYGVVSIGASITDGDLYATGTKFFITEHPTRADSAIRFACLEGGEVGVYHRGVGQLIDGVARIELPETFGMVAAGEITVQVTPRQASGALYVPADGMGTDGFTVIESGDSPSDASFTYLVMAERQGYTETPTVRALSLSEKILTSQQLSRGEKGTLRAALSRAAPERAPEQRAALFEALHVGDLESSCELLGGCRASVVSPARHHETPVSETPESSPPTPSFAPAEEDADPWAVIRRSSLKLPHVVTESVQPGDVVSLAPGTVALQRSSISHDRGVVGVVAWHAAPVPAGESARIAVAGVTLVRADAELGWIQAGDLLVAAPTPGHAMRADAPLPGSVLGKALEPLEGGQGLIRILLAPR